MMNLIGQACVIENNNMPGKCLPLLLISDQWVLTVVHCLPVTVVKLGSLRRSDNNEEHLKYTVIKVVSHPE